MQDNNRFENPYAVLNLPKDSPPEAVNYSYRMLARLWHPDRNPEDKKAAKRMADINRAYHQIKDSDPNNEIWKGVLDYKVRSIDDQLFRALAGHTSYIYLDCSDAEIRLVKKVDGPVDISDLVGPSFAPNFSAWENLTASSKRGQFYLYSNPTHYWDRGIELELEDILIAVAREKGEKINPRCIDPTLSWYGLRDHIGQRINEFCEALSQPYPNPNRIIADFNIGAVLPKKYKIGEMVGKTLMDFKSQLRDWIQTGWIKETPEGGLNISYEISDMDDMYDMYDRDSRKFTLKLSKKDYILIQVLVFGNKLLEAQK